MLTNEEKARLAELTAKKKKEKLDSDEYAEFKKLSQKVKGNGKRGQPGRGKDAGKEIPAGEPGTPGNDFSWWSKIPELIRDAASFKSNYIAGTQIDPVHIPYRVPGVIRQELRTCYGPSFRPTDPVNVWARNLYLKMFQKYRPASGYSASDLGIALLAGLEVVKLIATYERIYGVINRYSVLNINMPDGEAASLGLTSTQLTYLQSHMSDFRYDLNFLIRKAQRLCVPRSMALVADAISLFGYEYVDHDNSRGQLINFVLTNYGVYSDTALSTGGSISFAPTLLTELFDFSADNMCKALEGTLNALLGSDSIQRIYADLFVWFGEQAMLIFDPVPEDYVVVPVKSESILHKFHNMEAGPASAGSGQVYDTSSWAISGLTTADENIVLNGYYHVYQFNDSIVTVGAVYDGGTGAPGNFPVDGKSGKILFGNNGVISFGHCHVIDGYNVDVTPEFIVEATLFKYDSSYQGSPTTGCVITSAVAYLPGMTRMYDSTGTETSALRNYGSTGQPEAFACRMALVDWAPLAYFVQGSGNAITMSAVYGDLDVIVPCAPIDLQRIQRTCLLSGLQVDADVVTK